MVNGKGNAYKYVLFQLKILLKSKWFLLFVITTLGSNFILSDAAIRIAMNYQIPLKDVNYWHGVYECLNSNYIVLFVFVVFYLIFLFQNTSDLQNKFFILRLRNKKYWLLTKSLFVSLLPIIFTSIYYIIMLFGNLFFFGFPTSLDWGNYKVSRFGPVDGIVFSFFMKIFLLFVISWLFIYSYIKLQKVHKALVTCLTYYSFCYVFTTFIPSDLVKPITILGGISISYFELGNVNTNLISVFVIGSILLLTFYILSARELTKFEIT